MREGIVLTYARLLRRKGATLEGANDLLSGQLFQKSHCCDLTFRALIPNLEHLYIIEVLTHANATSMFKRPQMFTLIIMTPLQFELSQSSSDSWDVRQTCQLALTLVTTEIMI